MKTDFSIDVQVNLGVTPELVRLVSAILSRKPTTAQTDELITGTHAQIKEKPEDTAPAAPRQPTTKQGEKEKDKPTDTAKEDNPQAAEGHTPQGEAGQQPRERTEEDVRAAIHKTRQRIEGEDYKEHTDSDAYKKFHRQLTAQFKNISVLLGADKPSALPPEKRADFIQQCGFLQVLEDGTIGNTCPF